MTDPTMPSSDRDPLGDAPVSPDDEGLGDGGMNAPETGRSGDVTESPDVDPGEGDLPEDPDLTTTS